MPYLIGLALAATLSETVRRRMARWTMTVGRDAFTGQRNCRIQVHRLRVGRTPLWFDMGRAEGTTDVAYRIDGGPFQRPETVRRHPIPISQDTALDNPSGCEVALPLASLMSACLVLMRGGTGRRPIRFEIPSARRPGSRRAVGLFSRRQTADAVSRRADRPRRARRRMTILVSCAAWLMSAASTSAVPAAAVPLYAYVGPACDGVKLLPRLRSFLRRKEDGIVEFVDYRKDWRTAQGALGYGLACWRSGGVDNVAISLPMVVDAEGGIADDRSAQFAAFGRSLVQHGFPAAFVRIGWEFNGDWYRWTASPSVGKPDPNRPAKWVAAFRRDAQAIRATCPRCRIVWNPALYRQHVAPDQAYPGDDVVDVIGVDAYNSPRFPAPAPAANWAQTYGPLSEWGLAQFVRFAADHRKPLAYPEWGTPTDKGGKSGDEDGFFIARMAEVMARNPTAFQGWWDFNGGQVESNVSRGSAPAAEVAFQQAFGTERVRALLDGARLYRGPLTFTTPRFTSVMAERRDGELILLVWAGHPGERPGVHLSEPRPAAIVDLSTGQRRELKRGVDFTLDASDALQALSLARP